jgi:hypothetical protein
MSEFSTFNATRLRRRRRCGPAACTWLCCESEANCSIQCTGDKRNSRRQSLTRQFGVTRGQQDSGQCRCFAGASLSNHRRFTRTGAGWRRNGKHGA